MNDRHLLQARLAVRRAATRLTKDAPALAMAPANVREVGLAARVADLRQAVLAARRAGVCLQDITQDAGLETHGGKYCKMINFWCFTERQNGSGMITYLPKKPLIFNAFELTGSDAVAEGRWRAACTGGGCGSAVGSNNAVADI